MVFLFFVIVCMILSNFFLVSITPVNIPREVFPGDEMFSIIPDLQNSNVQGNVFYSGPVTQLLKDFSLKAVVYNRLVIHVLY